MATSLASVEVDLDEDPGGLVGRVLDGRFRVKSLLGVGGIGRVYRAEHVGLGRHVALKVLLEHYACVPELQRRFEREAAALSALRHPHIVTITDFVATPDVTFLVMELVEGPDLDQVLESGLAPEDALTIFAQILSCLAYAHERGVIHRDLKPQNVLITDLPGGHKHAVVLDFGLAKFLDPGGKHANLTQTGLIVGTPAYMAPEQASGGRSDARSDVYAMGILLFELLTGRLPFDGEQSDVLRQHLLKPPPTLSSLAAQATVAEDLEGFIARALAKSPGDRFRDAAAMLEAFQALPPSPFLSADAARPRGERGASTARTQLAVQPPARSLPAAVWALAGALVSGVLVALMFVVFGPDDDVPTLGELAEPSSLIAEAPEPELPSSDMVLTEQDTLDEALAQEAAEEEGEEPDGVTEPPEEASDPSLDEEADAPLDEDDEEAPVAPPRSRPRAANPWRGRTPSTLARVRRRISRRQPITKRHIRQVARYRASHPSDVRATLVLAHAYMARGWFSQALTQYQRAFRRQPSCRADARMRADLIRLAGLSAHHRRATAALAEIYGREAVPMLRRARARESDAAKRGRLGAALAQVSGR
ncbi:MAG: protein kinase [Sandaracinaceae bacterium]